MPDPVGFGVLVLGFVLQLMGFLVGIVVVVYGQWRKLRLGVAYVAKKKPKSCSK
jgi:hypothetical protein